MKLRWVVLVALASFVALPAAFVGLQLQASAVTTSHAGGTTGADPSNHSANPSHVWVSVGSPTNPSHVSSGGRYHDNCADLSSPADSVLDACYAADQGWWSTDLAGTGGAYLYLDYAGYAAGASSAPDTSRQISIYAYPSYRGNWASPSQAACYYTRYEVYVEFYDVGGTYHFNQIGRVTLGHLTSWANPVGSYIYPNASRPSGGGGTISYFSGLWIADVYNGSGACSGGAHVHLEGLAYHGYGSQYEWRGEGPDYFDYPSRHVHGCQGICGSDAPFSSWSDTTRGTVVGFLGGANSVPNMWDNPNYSGY